MKLSQSWSKLLSSVYGRPLDVLYAFLVHRVVSRGSFFSRGWGDLSCVKWLRERSKRVDWPPPRIEMHWKLLENGLRDGKKYSLLEGRFETPCSATVWNALPLESRKGLPKRSFGCKMWRIRSRLDIGSHRFKVGTNRMRFAFAWNRRSWIFASNADRDVAIKTCVAILICLHFQNDAVSFRILHRWFWNRLIMARVDLWVKWDAV